MSSSIEGAKIIAPIDWSFMMLNEGIESPVHRKCPSYESIRNVFHALLCFSFFGIEMSITLSL